MQEPVAIVGVAALLPGSPTVAEFWRAVVGGRDLMTDVPASRWLVEDHYDADPRAVDKTYGRRGAFLPDVEFDPLRYGIPPNNLSAIDTTQLLALVVAERVLADCTGRPVDPERVSVMVGASSLERMVEASARLQRPVWLRALREHGVPDDAARSICDQIAAHYVPWQEETFPGLLTNVVAGRIANRFDLRGVNHTTDAACASSLAAVYNGIAELRLGQSDLVVTGGVDTMNDVTMYTCFTRTPALSPTGDCRPFAADADGTMLGEGLVLFALKRLTDAERDGDRVYAVIRGVGASSDGRGAAIYAPVPDGQALALRRAYAAAGYGPETVELVEAHGTGTGAGDTAEFAALRAVFDASGRADRQWCALGSVKSQIGHTKSAAGAAGLLKAVLAVHHKVLPPTIKVDRPHPDLDVARSPFYLNTAARPWVRAAGTHPRRASVSSFGFGGTNFHCTIEEYPGGVVRRMPAAPTEFVLLGAESTVDLRARVGRLDTGGDL
ncbi:beta-ketoacyl synthase N-terminal-like domain-containing protein, partial [Virgisporangium aurantiacum]|uniref:beta-ketoacyl synthase N-terminal-like domain-containing protein n=1 Tax=Virgisporangium aurantiacum TaxID=175570 RepID=UPI0023B2BDC1